jgi:type II secretory pathway component PulF
MSKMRDTEISTVASAIANQMRAGVPLYQIVDRMSRLQPKHAVFWKTAAAGISQGRPLSFYLGEVWPPELVSAVRAGEISGRMENTFNHIESAIDTKLRLQATAMGLLYPVIIIVVTLGVAIFFMAWVLPAMKQGIGNVANGEPIMDMAVAFQKWLQEDWVFAAAGLGGAVLLGWNWIRTAEAKAQMIDFAVGLPYIGPALTDLYFGVWGEFIAMMSAAGVGLIDSLEHTANVLPVSLQTGARLMRMDLLNNKLTSDCVDPARLPKSDPRQQWPFFISHAFMVGEQTGRIDREMERVTPSLIKEGEKKLNLAIKVANYLALAIGGMLTSVPMSAVYQSQLHIMATVH